MTTFEIRIQSHIAESRLREAIDDFVSTLDLCNNIMPQAADDVSSLRHVLVLQSAALRKLVDAERTNTIDPKDAAITRARINNAVLDILSDLPNQHKQFYEFVLTLYQAQHTPTALTAEQQQAIEKLRVADATQLIHDVFVSYSSHDTQWVLSVCNMLRQHNLNVFVSAENLADTAGTFFSVKISNALRQSRHLVLVCTPAAMQSYWVQLEYQTFFNLYHTRDPLKRRLVVLQGEGFDIELVPDLLRSMQVASKPEHLITALTGQSALQSMAEIQRAIADEEKRMQAEALLQVENKKRELQQQIDEQKLQHDQALQRLDAERQRVQQQLEEEIRAQQEANERIEQQRREIEQKETTFKRLQDLEALQKAEAQRKAEQERIALLEQQRRDEPSGASLLENNLSGFSNADSVTETKKTPETQTLSGATHADRSRNAKTKYIVLAALALVLVVVLVWQPWRADRKKKHGSLHNKTTRQQVTALT